jgi:hypothetical protein
MKMYVCFFLEVLVFELRASWQIYLKKNTNNSEKETTAITWQLNPWGQGKGLGSQEVPKDSLLCEAWSQGRGCNYFPSPPPGRGISFSTSRWREGNVEMRGL